MDEIILGASFFIGMLMIAVQLDKLSINKAKRNANNKNAKSVDGQSEG